jgi:hypothetical protein
VNVSPDPLGVEAALEAARHGAEDGPIMAYEVRWDGGFARFATLEAACAFVPPSPDIDHEHLLAMSYRRPRLHYLKRGIKF